MPHLSTPEAEQLLDKLIPVLDKGHVRLVDWMGGDSRIVSAARVSYQEGTKTLRQDEGLINYLLSHEHTTPFEKVRFEFHVKVPIFIARQWMRHRMGSFNELSARYSVMKDEFYVPLPKQFRTQSEQNKQVGEGELSFTDAVDCTKATKQACESAYESYEFLLQTGVCREQARMVLPVNIYTEFYWTVDLWNLMHFLKLRLDWHAQKEIRDYAHAIAKCVEAVTPIAYKAFNEYIVSSVKFSKTEQALINELLNNSELDVQAASVDRLGKRAATEFCKKLDRIRTSGN